MKIRQEAIPHIGTVWIVVTGIAAIALMAGTSWFWTQLVAGSVLLLLTGYLFWFFRDPDREVPDGPHRIVSGADGRVSSITRHSPARFHEICLKSGLTGEVMARMPEFADKPVVRISVFLSLMDVHVNRAPIAGTSEYLGYFPGKHLLTIREKSSEVNQHNAIRIFNNHTGCLIFQIVGPVARRVVYWPDKSRPVAVGLGERIGMMKFGSRLDLYLPEPDIRLLVSPGDRVVAGITPLAELKGSSLF